MVRKVQVSDQRPHGPSKRNGVPALSKIDEPETTCLPIQLSSQIVSSDTVFFLANSVFSQPGDTVLDSFCGSGTSSWKLLFMTEK